VIAEPEFNVTLPMNGRIEYAFNHLMDLSSEVKMATLEHEGEVLSLRLDSTRFVRIQRNRVFFFFDPSRMSIGHYIFSVPEGAFVSEGGMLSPAISSEFVVVSKNCNTNYVVSGMKGEKCKCFSVGDQCQCTCGETFFSREF